MSVRPKRVSHPVVRYEGLESLNNVWSTADKRALLNALQKHGHMDIKKLSEALPHKSPKAIKNMIVSTMTAARRSTKTGQTPPIDMWLEQASSDETNALIPQALLFISLFERHPPPELCDGCDLRSVYDFIYRMTRGHPAVDLDHRTRKILYKVISRTVSKMRVKAPENLLFFISNLYKTTILRDYTRKMGTSQKITTDTIIQELNTFMVPSDKLRIS